MSYLFNNKVELTNLDAFGRSRTSESMTIADYTHIYGQNSEMLFKTSGSGTYSYMTNEASVRLSVGTGSGDYVIHQSRMYHHYLPGKSQLTYSSFNFINSSTNSEKKVGYYDDRNGIFLNLDGSGNLSFVQRSYTTGTVSETSYSQSSWNKDKCDGTGKSQFNLDITKTQLVFFDFQWLGVGRLRCGFVHDGSFIIAHEIYHSNLLDKVYWSNPALPVRCEVINTGIGSATSSLDQICSTVISEGGYDLAGYDYAAYASKDITSAGTPTLIGALRLSDTFNGYPNRATIFPGDLGVLSKFSNVRYEIWRLPGTMSVTGGSWVSAGNESAAEYNITPTGFTTSGGDLLRVGFVNGSSTLGGKGIDPTVSPSFFQTGGMNAKKTFISQNIDSNNSNIIGVVVTPLDGATASVNSSFSWREVY
jgi:hypothetical protein